MIQVRAEQHAPLIRRAVVSRGEPPACRELVFGKQAGGDFAVADIQREQH